MNSNSYTPADRPARRVDAHWKQFWLLLAVLALVVVAWLYLNPTPPGDGSGPVTVVVQRGEGWTELTDRLTQAGIVRRPLTFKALVLVSRARSRLMPGRYQLRRGMSAREIISLLTDPQSPSRVTIPEGWRLEQVGERLSARQLATPDQWRSALARPPAAGVLASKPASVSLEGYIYPDTYQFDQQDAASQLVAEALKNLDERLTPDVRAGIRAQNLTVHQALTLASIVEREAQVPEERPVIASVYLNRLKKGMKLQADPTVQYAVGGPGNWWKQGLTKSDLANPSPYNTYVYAGLPPGPICSPGIASIEAVAHPARTSYLYFVAKGDGTHAFAETEQEHDRNVQRYLGR